MKKLLRSFVSLMCAALMLSVCAADLPANLHDHAITAEAAASAPAKITGLTLKGRSGTALRIGWNKVASADGYIVWQKVGTTWKRIAKITNNSTTEYRISGLKPGTKYTFRVRAYKMSGSTALYGGNADASYRTNPSVVSGLNLKGRSGDALRLGWNKNTSADGYIIEQKINGVWTRIKKITTNATTEYRISGLKPGTAYSFRIRTYKMSGSTPLYSGYTSGSYRTNPSVVTGFYMKNNSADAIRLAWNKNTSADGYIIEQKVNGAWKRITKITTNATTEYRVSGLQATTAYDFRIRTYKMSGTTPLYSAYTTGTFSTKDPTATGEWKGAAYFGVPAAKQAIASYTGYFTRFKGDKNYYTAEVYRAQGTALAGTTNWVDVVKVNLSTSSTSPVYIKFTFDAGNLVTGTETYKGFIARGPWFNDRDLDYEVKNQYTTWFDEVYFKAIYVDNTGNTPSLFYYRVKSTYKVTNINDDWTITTTPYYHTLEGVVSGYVQPYDKNNPPLTSCMVCGGTQRCTYCKGTGYIVGTRCTDCYGSGRCKYC